MWARVGVWWGERGIWGCGEVGERGEEGWVRIREFSYRTVNLDVARLESTHAGNPVVLGFANPFSTWRWLETSFRRLSCPESSWMSSARISLCDQPRTFSLSIG